MKKTRACEIKKQCQKSGIICNISNQSDNLLKEIHFYACLLSNSIICLRFTFPVGVTGNDSTQIISLGIRNFGSFCDKRSIILFF